MKTRHDICQMCWENECSQSWWNRLNVIQQTNIMKLIEQHPELAASILKGALSVMKDRLLPCEDDATLNIWCDSELDMEWSGPHVGVLCHYIVEEIERACYAISTGCEERVVDKIRARRDAGRAKYNATMERTDLSQDQWLKHAQEEALDLAVYLEKLLTKP